MHRCAGCGGSCEQVSVWTAPEERAGLAARAAELGIDRPLRRDHRLRLNAGRCVFLGEDRRCALHARWGLAAKPATCRQFPQLPQGIDPACFLGTWTPQPGPLDGIDSWPDLVDALGGPAPGRWPWHIWAESMPWEAQLRRALLDLAARPQPGPPPIGPARQRIGAHLRMNLSPDLGRDGTRRAWAVLLTHVSSRAPDRWPAALAAWSRLLRTSVGHEVLAQIE